MTPAENEFERAGAQLRLARARLLLQLARPDVAVGDLLSFARSIGDETLADNVSAFRSAQEAALQAAQAELHRFQH